MKSLNLDLFQNHFSDSFEKVSVLIESGLAGPIEAGGMVDNSYFDNSRMGHWLG